MKIIFVDTTFNGPLIGGAQTFLPPLMKQLKENGHDVHLVIKDKVHTKIIDLLGQSGAVVHTHLWSKKALVEDATPIFAKWINDQKPDVYVISVATDIGWTVLPLLNPGIATFTIGHTDDNTFYAPAKHYSGFISKAIGVSKEICKNYITKSEVVSQDVICINYGVISNPVVPVHNTHDVIKLIYVGRVVEEQKRISDLIKIALELSSRKVNYQLTIVGDGPSMSDVKKELRNEITTGNVQIKGWLRSEDVITSLRESAIFLLTSSYEGFCISLIEAMANGCCPLVTDIKSGNKELITDSYNGHIFSIGATGSFVNKIISLAAQPTELLMLRQNAWQKGMEFSIRKMTASYEAAFNEGITKTRNQKRFINQEFPILESCRSLYPLWMRRIKKLIKE